MFSITSEQRQYMTYILADLFEESQIEVVPERGGIVTSWRIRGQELFYLDTERFTHPDLSVRGGIPILFPICGNLPGNTYTHKGQTYTLKQHGFAREMPWQVVAQDADGVASLTVSLKSNAQTLTVYPFEFEVRYTYSLVGTCLKIQQTYLNLSPDPMPFVAGFHPYFSVQDKTKLHLQIPATELYDHQTQQTEAFDGSVDFGRPEIDVAFKSLSAARAEVKDLGTGLTLVINYDSQFSTLVFWTVKGKDFYCLEPWTAPRNALVSGENLQVLQPGTSLETSVSFTVSRI